VPVLRGEVLPERIPPGGLMILRDGNPGEPGVTLSPLMYHYQGDYQASWTGNRRAASRAALASFGP